ncbi:cell division ATP-binding protein FtsE [Candidatus Saccharibacteria bacterium]|nr:cell division ATP-binding protein FtsE [Candidatus Saccharibacteria bacterium]
MILLDSVTKRYSGDAEPALDNVSLHIEPNEFVFLVGKSGAGKSTLIKMLTKEETPDSGKIIVGGIDLAYVKKRHVPSYRRRLGVVFQDFKLLPRRTVYENVAFALEIMGMSGKEIRKTVPKVLELVDLLDQANKFPGQLSGGQQQRVSIARSVARQPKILIADEPTANLDKLTTSEIIDLLRKINDFGTTILVTTHNENIVNNLQKRVVTLKKGRIVNDQKNNGIYELDETPIPEKPSRILQAPGHALRRPLVFETTRVEVEPVAAKKEPVVAKKEVKVTKVKKEEKKEIKKEVKQEPKVPKVLKQSSVKKKPLPTPTRVPGVSVRTMPNMARRTIPKRGKIAKSNVI